MDDFDPLASPGVGLGITPFDTVTQTPESDADPERDAAFKRWESMRPGQTGAAPPVAEPPVGTSPLAQDLDQSGFFDQETTAHASELGRELEEAIARSQAGAPPPAPKAQSRPTAPSITPPTPDGGFPGFLIQPETLTSADQPVLPGAPLLDIGRGVVNTAGQTPGGIPTMIGGFLQAPDVVVSSVQRLAQTEREWQLLAMEAIDSGEPLLPPRPSRLPASTIPGPDVRLAQYIHASPEERARLRVALQAEIAAFNPTPIQQRPLYQAGSWLQETGRTLVPQLEGFDENSWSTQIGRGLGSMITGLGVSGFLGRAAGGVFFAGAGMGESTERAVQFDQRERAAGRPGLTQDQIIAAGLLGIAPGTTDMVPVEHALQRLRIPGLTPQTTALLARVLGRTGGRVLVQSFLEGGQESLQQFLQNLIAREVYNPSQALGEGVLGAGGVGAIVGGTAEGGLTAGRALLGRRGRGARGAATDTAPAPAPEADTPIGVNPETPPPEQALPFGLDRWVAPETPPEAVGGQEPVSGTPSTPEAETAPEATPGAPLASTIVEATTSGAEFRPAGAAVPVSVSAAPVAEQIGQPREIVTPDGGMRVQAVPEIVELDSLTAAAGALQPRDRSRAEAQQAVRQIASGLDPEQLMPGRVSDAGAPIVTADGTVISGNGRVAAVRQAYGQKGLKARSDAYRVALGPAAEGFRNPVLVMRLPDMEQGELTRFADLSNRARISAMSATERATRDASAAGADVMGLYQGGSFTSPANSEFFRAFASRVVTAAERGTFSKDGNLSQEGQKRLQAAVLAAAYGNVDLLTTMLESTDDTARALIGALNDAAGPFIRLKASIASGEVSAEFDITPQIVDATQRIIHIRDRGIKPANYLAQQDAFTQIDPVAEALIRSFYTEGFGRALGRQRLTEFLNGYATEASQHTTEAGLIPDTTTPLDIIGTAYRNAVRDDTLAARLAAGQFDIFASRPSDSSGRDAGDGGTIPGPAGGSAESTAERGRTQPADDAGLARRFVSLLAGKLPSDQWRRSLAVDEQTFQGLVDRAVAAGLLRIDAKGVVRRTAAAKAASLDALSQASPEQLFALSDHRERNAAFERWRRGQTYEVESTTVSATLEAIEPILHEVPSEVPVKVLYKVEPYTSTPEVAAAHRAAGRLAPNLRAFYVDHDGVVSSQLFAADPTGSASGFFDMAAVFSFDGNFGRAVNGRILVQTFGHIGGAHQFTNAIRGKIRHEVGHAIRTLKIIDGASWGVLVSVSHRLNVLGRSWREWGRLRSEPEWRKLDSKLTLRDTYQRAYGQRYKGAELQEVFDQEAVSHTLELITHGQVTEQDLGPAYEIFQRIIAGEFGRGIQQPSPVYDPGSIERLAEQAANQGRLAEMEAALDLLRARTVRTDTIAEAVKEKKKLKPNQLNSLIGQALQDPATDLEAVQTVTDAATARIDEEAASALEVLDNPETTPQEALDAIEHLRTLREWRNGFSTNSLAAMVGPTWSDEDLEQLYQSELEEGARKARVKETTPPQEMRKRSYEPRAAITRQAERLAKEVADAEKALAAEGKTAAEIAAELSSRFKIEVTADQIARSMVWWRVDEILAGEAGFGRTRKGRFAKTVFTADVIAEMQRAWGQVRSLGQLVDHLTEYSGRQMSWHSVASMLLRHGGSTRNARQISEAKAADEALRQALLGEDMRELPAAAQADQLTARLGRRVTVKMVRDRREQLGLFYRNDAKRVAAEQSLRDALRSDAIRDLPLQEQAERLTEQLGRPVSWNMVVDRRQQLGIKRDFTARVARPEIDTFLLSEEGKALDAPRAAEALSQQLGRAVAADLVKTARKRLASQGQDVGDHRASFWTGDADALILSEDGRHMTASQLAERLSQMLGRSITTKAVYGRREILRSRGHKVEALSNRWTAEDIAALTAEDVRDIGHAAASRLLTERLGRRVSPDTIRDQRRRLAENPVVEQAGSQLLASLVAPSGGTATASATEPIKPLRDIVADLKSELNLTTTHGLQTITVTDRSRGVSETFAPKFGARGRYDERAGIGRVSDLLDIEAIARVGGRHIQRLFGSDMQTFLAANAEALAVPPAPDRPMPVLNATGFSGLELDADTQGRLFTSVNAMREWQALGGAANAASRAVAGRVAAAMDTLERRLGRTITGRLVTDAARVDPGQLAGYVRQRYTSTTGTPPPAPGTVRMYHGGAPDPSDTAPIWFSSDRTYAEGWAARSPGMRLWYVDVPRSDPRFTPADEMPGVPGQQTLERGFTFNFEVAGPRQVVRAPGEPSTRPAPTASPEAVKEAFSRFFERYIINPAATERSDPGVYTAFEDFLDAEHPGMLEDLQRLQLLVISQAYRQYADATTLERGRVDLISEADDRFSTWLRKLRQTVGSADTFTALANFLYSRGVNENNSWDQAVRKLMEVADRNRKTDASGRAMSLAVHENPAKLMRAIADAFKTGLAWLQHGMPVYRSRDAGWQIVDANGVAQTAVHPTLAEAQTALRSVPGGSLVEVEGSRSGSIRGALELAGAFTSRQVYVDFGMFLESRRAIMEWARWEAQGSRPNSDGRGLRTEPHRVPRAEHEQRIRELEQLHPTFPQAAQVVYDFVWASAVHDHAAGRLSDEELAYRATRRHAYVPWNRDFSDMITRQTGARAKLRQFWKDLPIVGSERDLRHPIEALVDQTFHRGAATALNEALVAFANLAENVGPGGAAIAERVNRTEEVEANSAAFRQLEQDLMAMGYDRDDASDIVKRLESEWGDQNLLLQSLAPTLGRPLLVPIFEGGKRNFLRLNDPDFSQEIWNALNGMGREQANTLTDIMAAPARWLRAGATTSAGFLAINPVRDAIMAWGLTGATPVVTQLKGLRHEVGQTTFARRYSEGAGIFGGANVATLSKVKDKSRALDLQYSGLAINKKGLAAGATIGAGLGFLTFGLPGAYFGAFAGMFLHRGPRHFVSSASHFADVSETMTRFGVADTAYKAALAYNPHLTPYQAMQEANLVARDIADYSRRGSRMFVVSRVVAFINPAIQGVDRTIRGLLARSDRGNAFSTTKLTAIIAAAGVGAGLAAGPAVGVAAAMAAGTATANLAARSAAARALLMPFFRAKVVGLPVSAEEQRAMAESAKMWIRWTAIMFAGAVIKALFWDDDRYRRIRPEVLNRYQPIAPLGAGPTAEWLTLPRAWDMSFPSVVMEAALDAQFRSDPRFLRRVRDSAWDMLVPPGVPQAYRLWGDISANYDSFRGRPLVSPWRRHLSPEQQYDAYSSQLAIRLSRFVNSRPWLRSATESVGSVPFGSRFQLTPAIIDHALRTGLAGWGQDIQRGSDAAVLGASRVQDMPLIGGILRRFLLDPNRSSDAVALYREMAYEGHGYTSAAASYTARLVDQGAQDANTYLAGLSAELRAYALGQATGDTDERRRHPWNRLHSLVEISQRIEREILERRFASTGGSRPVPIDLTASQMVQTRQVMALIRAVEANNSFVLLRQGQFANLGMLPIEPAMELLKAISPNVHQEYLRRLRTDNVERFATVARSWPLRRNSLLRRWQEAVDRDAAAVLRGTQEPRRLQLPIGANPPEPDVDVPDADTPEFELAPG